MEKIIVEISWDKNYSAVLENVNGIVIATHKTLEGVKKEFESALKFHIEGLRKDHDDIPKSLRGYYELVFKQDVHALLNTYKGVISHSALSKVSGINKKQLGHYAQGKKIPRSPQREKIIKGFHKLGQEFIKVM